MSEAATERKKVWSETVVIRSAQEAHQAGAFDLRWQAATFFFSTIILIAGSVSVWLFSYTFWALLETAAIMLHLHRGESLLLHGALRLFSGEGRWQSGAEGWPLDIAICLGVLSAVGFLYLGFDRLGALGNRHAAHLLLHKARRQLKRPVPGSIQGARVRHFFVEVRRGGKNLLLPSDIGWLFLYPTRLIFIGDTVRAEFPRSIVSEKITMKRGVGGLSGDWVEIQVTDPPESVRFLPRDRVRRISDSGRLAPSLAAALREWQGDESGVSS